MRGCCGAESQKFKTKDGEIDRERLSKLVADKRQSGWSETQLQRLERCDCICHCDGVICRC